MLDYKISEELKKEFLEHYKSGDIWGLEVLKKEREHFSENQKSLYHCVMLLNEVNDYYENNIDKCGVEFNYNIYSINRDKFLESVGIDTEEVYNYLNS